MLTRYCSSDDGGSPGGAGRRAAKWAWAGTRAGGHVAPGAIVSTVSWRSVGTVRVAAHRRRRRQRARCAACGPSGAASAAPRGRRSSPSRPMWLGVRRFRPVIPGSQRAVRRSHGPNPRNGDQETRPRRRINWGVQGSNQAGRLRAEAGQCGSCSPQPINVAAVPRSRSTWQLFPAAGQRGSCSTQPINVAAVPRRQMEGRGSRQVHRSCAEFFEGVCAFLGRFGRGKHRFAGKRTERPNQRLESAFGSALPPLSFSLSLSLSVCSQFKKKKNAKTRQ